MNNCNVCERQEIKAKRLGIDPFASKPIGGLDMLISSTTEPRDLNVKETPSTAKPKRGRPTEIKRDITKTSQSGLREGLTRATFIIREDTLDRLKDRAYTDRKKLKDLVSEALDYYLDKAMRASKDYKQTENGLKLISWVSVILAGFATLGILLDGGDGYAFFGTILFALNGGLGLRYIHLNKE